ncbi:MAG: Pvc16 family protein [Caldilineaceae bacterium]
MSNYLAVATVTAALRDLMQEAVNATGISATVTTQRPAAVSSDGANPARVNLYLYQVTPNPYLGNQDLPTRRADGGLVERPQVALNLHYLLSFYGNETEWEPERLLGKAVSVLHAQPQLSRARLRSLVEKHLLLKTSDLADQIELVKFTPLCLNLEEFSKLWSVFFQTTYTLSVAYAAAVVLITGDELPELAKPVQTPALAAIPSVTAIKATPPDALANLQFWFSGDKGITQAKSGQVTLWLDQSRKQETQHGSAQQNQPNAQPLLVRNGLNRKALVRFGGDDYLALAEAPYATPGAVSGITLFALVRSVSSDPQILLSFDADHYWSVALHSGAAGGIGWHTHAQTAAGAHSLITPKPYTDGNWHLVCVWFNAGASPDKQIFVDGQQVSASDAHAGEKLGTGAVRYGLMGVGSHADTLDGPIGPLEFFKGDLAELVLYARGLAAEERQQIEQYFLEKYNNRG